MRHPAFLVTVLAIVLGTMGGTFAQDTPQFSTATELVVLGVHVTDRKGIHVPGLTRERFSILEDDRSQTVELFAREDAPVTVGLLIDSSISMWAIRDRLIAGAVAFAEASNPDDELFAIAFNEHLHPALSPEDPFTSDPRTLGDALSASIQPRGRTALFDALAAGFDYAGRGRHARQILIIISDGGDNASSVTADSALKKARSSNVVIYTVAVVDPLDQSANPAMLSRLAEASGGRAFRPETAERVRDVLREIARDIRNAYVVGYVSDRPADGAYRRLRVGVSAPDRGSLVVRARAGYLAAAPVARPPGDEPHAR